MRKFLAEYIFYLALGQEKRGKYDIALFLILISMSLIKTTNCLNLKGRIYFKQKKYKNAVKIFNDALKLSENMTSYVGIITVELSQKKYLDVIKTCNRALKYDCNDLNIKVWMATAYAHLEYNNEAQKLVNELLGKSQFDPLLNVILVKTYLSEKKLDEAYDYIQNLFKWDRTKKAGFYYLAEYYFLNGDFINAQRNIDQISEKDLPEDSVSDYTHLRVKIYDEIKLLN